MNMLPAPRPALRFAVGPPSALAARTHWKINGFPASVLVWTAEQWSLLATRPDDAQRSPDGSWCVLRMD